MWILQGWERRTLEWH